MPHKTIFIHCKLRCGVGHWVSVDEYTLECEWMNMARYIWQDSVVSVMPHKSVFIHFAISIHCHSSLYPSTAPWRTIQYSSPVPSKKAFERSFLFCRSFPVGATVWRRPQQDAWSCTSLSAKEPLLIRLFCGKWPVRIRHPTGFRHRACQLTGFIRQGSFDWSRVDLRASSASWFSISEQIIVFSAISVI